MKCIVFLLFICVACTGRHTNSVVPSIQYDFSTVSTESIQEHIKEIKLIPMEIVDDGLFRNPDKVIVKDSLIYIGDYFTSSIKIFDINGRYINSISKKGRGYGEYLEMRNFTIDDNYIYIIDNYNHMVHIYSRLAYTYIESKQISFVAWDMAALNNGDFLFTFIPYPTGKVNLEQPNYKIFITGNDFIIKDKMYQYSAKSSEPLGYKSYFVELPDRTIFSSFTFDGITEFKSSPEDSKQIGFTYDVPIPNKYRFQNPDLSKNKWTYMISTPQITDNYIALDLVVDDHWESFVYSIKSQVLMANSKEPNGTIFFTPICTIDNKFVSLIRSIEEYECLVLNGMPDSNPKIRENIEKGGYVMLFYHLD